MPWVAAPGWRSAHRRCLAVLRHMSTPDELVPSYRGNHSGSYRADQAASLRSRYLLKAGNMCFILTIREGIEMPFPPPTMACMRQIAHELMVTLQRKLKSKLVFTYLI